MDNKEAIKKLKEQQAEFNDTYVDFAGTNEAYNLAIKALEEKEADRWIPVSEKLPEKDGAFLICTPSGLIETSVFTFGQFTRPYVIAWKHLPEPYDWRTENE